MFSRFLNDKMIKKLSDDQKSIQNEKNDHSRIATTEESDSNVQFRRIPEARPSPLVDPQSLINPRIGGADLGIYLCLLIVRFSSISLNQTL